MRNVLDFSLYDRITEAYVFLSLDAITPWKKGLWLSNFDLSRVQAAIRETLSNRCAGLRAAVALDCLLDQETSLGVSSWVNIVCPSLIVDNRAWEQQWSGILTMISADQCTLQLISNPALRNAVLRCGGDIMNFAQSGNSDVESDIRFSDLDHRILGESEISTERIASLVEQILSANVFAECWERSCGRLTIRDLDALYAAATEFRKGTNDFRPISFPGIWRARLRTFWSVYDGR